MKAYHCFLSILFFLVANNFMYGQSAGRLINKEPGKCFAKCLVADVYETEELTLPIYIGYDEDKVELLVFEFEETGEEIFYLADTTDNKDFILETFTIERLVQKRGFTEWRKVVCGDKVGQYLLSNLADRLNDLDFYQGSLMPSILDKELKDALCAYQKANGLPVGQLDFETLNALNIRY